MRFAMGILNKEIFMQVQHFCTQNYCKFAMNAKYIHFTGSVIHLVHIKYRTNKPVLKTHCKSHTILRTNVHCNNMHQIKIV